MVVSLDAVGLNRAEPHAETEALFQAGKNAAGADVYVT